MTPALPRMVVAVAAATLLLAPRSAPAEQGTAAHAADAPRTAPTGGLKLMRVTRAGTQPSQKGPADWFTGSVRIDPLFQVGAPGRVAGVQVTFEPCSRTHWHAHPLGQTLIVVSGMGRVQEWGGPVQEIRPGDVVWTPPGVKHWHGAAPTTAMSHLAIQEALDGKVVAWMEKVSDEQYVQQSGVGRE